MKRYVVISADSHPTKINWWRLAVIALGVMILSGCQAIEPSGDHRRLITGDPYAMQITRRGEPIGELAPVVIPESAGSFDFGDTGYCETFSDLDDGEQLPCGDLAGDSMIVRDAQRLQLLPRDEYLCDGGDGLYTSYAGLSEERGLEPTDTVAQYDTDDGQAHIVASNRVCIYAPRFAATRRITGLRNREVVARVGGLHERVTAEAETVQSKTVDVRRNLTAERQIGTTIRHEFHDATRGLLVDDVEVPWEWGRRMLPLENRRALRLVELSSNELALLKQAATAAGEWESSEALELVIDGQPAQMMTGIGQPSSVVVYETMDGEPRLQLIKLASGQPGSAEAPDTVSFTIHFDNRGDVPISNIKIVDSLATRLEYIADSEECTLRALFSAADNVAGSTKLEWEVREELKPGEGGAIRFRCRVR